MSKTQGATHEKLKADLLALLCIIIKRELSRPPYAVACTTPPNCPRCGNRHTTKRGHDATGKQRYRCSACNRSFTTATGSPLSSTNVPLDTWLVFAECCADRQSLRDSALRCGVSLKTAFFMRKRLNNAIVDYSGKVKRSLQAFKCKNLHRQFEHQQAAIQRFSALEMRRIEDCELGMRQRELADNRNDAAP